MWKAGRWKDGDENAAKKKVQVRILFAANANA